MSWCFKTWWVVCATAISGFGSNDQMLAENYEIRLTVIDAQNGVPVPSRVYLTSESGQTYFFALSADLIGGKIPATIRYAKQNWINERSREYHTTVIAYPVVAKVPPGRYSLVVERGKSYVPDVRELVVEDRDLKVNVTLDRWINPAQRGWFSGDTHIHRTLDEARNVVLAEDLNVIFPLTNWVTFSDTLPGHGDRNLEVELPAKLVVVDDTHVIWPLNTEYEIFTVGGKQHTLGALFFLGHRSPLPATVPPWRPAVELGQATNPDVLFDMDKLDWPFAMTLPTVVPGALYELSNNHLWRTEFAFEEWNTAAPPFMLPPYGSSSGGERDWIDYTLGMYYTLLNCGLELPPSAGTANGVHPVPAGFSRVYVHQPDGFDYEGWIDGLRVGRSFVTTGPMLFASANGHDSGHHFRSEPEEEILVNLDVISETPLLYGEIVVNGRPEHLLRPSNRETPAGAFETKLSVPVQVVRSGWFAVRWWEQRPDGRIRFAHTAPWYVSVGDQPVVPSSDERDYLVRRMEEEIERSRDLVSNAARREYQDALEFYRSLPLYDDSKEVALMSRPFRNAKDRERWLNNMIDHHRYSAAELRRATGLSLETARSELEARVANGTKDPSTPQSLEVLPYPGGRHPRRGFLEGAINPQRETKISVFPPWNDGGYVVVDVPEAIFSNLGLTYLAHSHIPTIWDEIGETLAQEEWVERGDQLLMERTLPNGIEFGTVVTKHPEWVEMEIWLYNGTDQLLTDLRTQVCLMLTGAPGFNAQQNLDQISQEPLIAIKSMTGDRWIMTAWEPCNRVWSNPPVPCKHSDPIFPDCPPGDKVRVHGGLWFYEGDDIERKIGQVRETYLNRRR